MQQYGDPPRGSGRGQGEQRAEANGKAATGCTHLKGGRVYPASRKHRVCLGDTFVRLPHAMVKARLEQDQGRLEKQIDGMRDGVKRKSAQICEIDPTMCVRACVRTRTASLQHHHAVRTRTASL